MSLDALDVMRDHRTNQIESSPASEEFRIIGGSTFFGIFERSHLEDNKDSGNITQKSLTPRILVSEIPVGLTERVSQITREDPGKEYTFNFAGLDDEGIPILWLF